MELRHLRYFEMLGRTLNFSRAAEQLHMAQPPLSRQIRQLEDELGAQLIDREARPLALTKAGAFFYEQCVQMLARLQEIERATKRIAQTQRRWFGIGFVPSVLYGFLPELIRRYRLGNKDVEVVLSTLTTIEQCEALKAGRIDVGFGRLVLDDPQIASEVIEDEPLVAALPRRHRLLKSTRVKLSQLAVEPFILYPVRPRPSYADHVLQQFRSHGLSLSSVIESNDMQTALGLVAAGIGTTLLPQSAQGLRRDDVAYRPIADSGVTSPVIMHFRVTDDSSELQRFHKLLRQIV